jgi:hypothetical protein
MTILRVQAVRPGASKKARALRRPTLANALKQADKAGKSVRGVVIDPDGKFELKFGEPDAPQSDNPWDKVLHNEPH